MKKLLLVALATTYLTSIASANVIVDSFTATPDFIPVGGTSTLNLRIEVTPDGGFFNAFISGGSVQMFSGDGTGPALPFLQTGSTVTVDDLSTSFTYLGFPASMFPSYTGNISYTESHFVQVYVGEAFGSCGFFGGTCDLGPIFQTQLETLTFTNSISGSTGLTTYDAAPVPGPIVGAGLPGLLGMLGFGGWQWRRRKKIA